MRFVLHSAVFKGVDAADVIDLVLSPVSGLDVAAVGGGFIDAVGVVSVDGHGLKCVIEVSDDDGVRL